jgi:hypothetical protein
MMNQASLEPIPGRAANGYPQEPIDMKVARGLLAIELAYGGDAADARAASTLSMTERDVAMASIDEIEPPKISEEELAAALTRLLAHLRGSNQQPIPEAAE